MSELPEGDPVGETMSPVRAPATYQLVVEQLRRALALGRFGPGDRFPPERELVRQLGVSRASLREAVRVLEGEGLVEVRRGASGGIMVLDLAERQLSVAEAKEQIKQLASITEYRLAVETATARLAAERRSDEEAAGLERIAAGFDENAARALASEDRDERARLTTEFMRMDNEFHLTIAKVAQNGYLFEAVQRGRLGVFRPVGTVFGKLHENANYQHREIAAAISAGDPDAAGAAMAAHIEETRSQLLEEFRAITTQ